MRLLRCRGNAPLLSPLVGRAFVRILGCGALAEARTRFISSVCIVDTMYVVDLRAAAVIWIFPSFVELRA